MSQLITFYSVCPTCSHQQIQDGYTCAALMRLLERGRIIEAYCLTCDVLWPVSPAERVALARALTPEQRDSRLPSGVPLPDRPAHSRRE
jgi:hypothetical protein